MVSFLSTSMLQEALRWWVPEYYRLMKEWKDNGKFIGKDQLLMDSIVETNRHRVFVLLGTGE